MELRAAELDTLRVPVMGEREGVGMSYRAEDFQADGALRDVCILDASIDDWQRILDGQVR